MDIKKKKKKLTPKKKTRIRTANARRGDLYIKNLIKYYYSIIRE